MNNKNLLFTIILGGALAGIFAWAFYSGAFLEIFPLTNSNLSDDADSSTNADFEPLEKNSTTPAEVNDDSLKELDSYMKNVDSTGSEDLSDLE